MKKLIIVLASIPAYFIFFNSSEGGEWVKDQNGCKLWNGTDMPVKKVSWVGKCKNGYASGKGQLSMFWTEEQQIKCEKAQIKNGKNHGYNECKWADGTSYKGTFKDDHVVSGEYTYKGGNKSKVSWFESENGCLVWNSVPQPGERVTWDGACFKGYAKGLGTLTFTSKDMKQRYVGEMNNGIKNGEGTFHWLQHDKPCDEQKNKYYCYKNFVGKFKNGQFDEGTYTLINGKKEKGKSQHDKNLAEVKAIIQNSFELEMEIQSLESQREIWKDIQ